MLTDGADGLDFAQTSGGTCTGGSFAAGDRCTVNLTFTPHVVGGRRGAVLLLNGSTLLATGYVWGNGSGAQLAYAPAAQTMLPGFGAGIPVRHAAVDSAQNLYVINTSGHLGKVPWTGSAYGAATEISAGLISPLAVAVDGSGAVYVADNNIDHIIKIPWTGASYGTPVAVGSYTGHPLSVALDGSGNVYVADRNLTTITKIPWTGTGYGTPVAVGGGMTAPEFVAVDAKGNVFAAEPSYGRVHRIPWTGAGYGANLTLSLSDTVTGMTGMAVDPSGNVYVADNPNGKIWQVNWTGSGFGTPVSLGFSGLSALNGVTVDSRGNVYTWNNLVAIAKLPVADPPSLDFGVLRPGDAASSRSFTLANVGDGNLTFTAPASGSTNPTLPNGFSLGPNTNCPSLASSSTTATLAARSSCVYQVQVTPGTPGSMSGMMTLAGTNLDASESVQNIPLTAAVTGHCNATTTTASLALAPYSDAAQSVTLVARVTQHNQELGAAGSVTFTVLNGQTVVGSPATGGMRDDSTAAVNYWLPAALPVGLYTIRAVYNGHPSEYPSMTMEPSSDSTHTLAIGLFSTVTAASSLVTAYNAAAQNVTLMATVTSPLGPVSSGTVTFTVSNGATVMGTAVAAGPHDGQAVATYVLPAGTAKGTYSLGAVYNPGPALITSSDNSAHLVVGDQMVYDLGSTPIGIPTAALTLTLSLPQNTTLGATMPYQVLTQNATGQDFADAGGGTCTAGHAYSAGQTCTVRVVLTPKVAGARHGAVRLLDSGGNAISTVYLRGIGTGPQVVFWPGSLSQPLSWPSYLYAAAIAVDGGDNVYFTDIYNNKLQKLPWMGSGYGDLVTVTSDVNIPNDLAVDGAGNLYVADSYNSRILKIPFLRGAYGPPVTLIDNIFAAQGVAVDGSGNVYLGDSSHQLVLKLPFTGSGYAAPVTVISGADLPEHLAVDGNGNVYCTVYVNTLDTSLRQVLKVPWTGSAYGAAVTVYTSSSAFLLSIAVDASGDLYVSDSGRLILVPWRGSAYASPIELPYTDNTAAAAVNGRGNIYIASGWGIYLRNLADPATFDFGTVAANTTTAAQTLTLSNIGNADLSLPAPASGSNPALTSGYSLTADTTCPTLSSSSSAATLPRASSCTYTFQYTSGLVPGSHPGTLVLTDNTRNVSGATQTFPLAANVNIISTTTTAAALTPLSYSRSSQSVSVSAIVTSTLLPVNQGAVTFALLSGSTVIGSPITSTVVNGAAGGTYVVPASTPGGTYTLRAVYTPGSTFVTSTDSSRTLVIAAVATTTSASSASADVLHAAQLSATVTSSIATVNEGELTFTVLKGSTVIGTPMLVTVSGGVAHTPYQLPAVAEPGTYTIQAVYNGTANFLTSSDSSHTLTASALASTTTAAAASTTYSTAAQNVTLSAIVAASGGVTQGTVTFTLFRGATAVGTPVTSGTVAAGTASVTYAIPAGTPVGTYAIQAVYSPGPLYLASSDSSHSLTIGTAAATVSFNSLTVNCTGGPLAVPVTTTPSGLPLSFTFNGSATAPTLPGIYAVVATVTDPNYVGSASATVSATLPAVDFGAVNIGSPSTTMPAVLLFSASTTLGGSTPYQVLTQGAAGLDFADAGGGTCAAGAAYSAGQSCTVNVRLTPRSAGLRTGAVMALDAGGNTVGSVYLRGLAIGPQAMFSPGVQTVISRRLPNAVAVDGSGNLFMVSTSVPAVMLPWTGSDYGTASNIGTPLPASGVVVDGMGNIYLASGSSTAVAKIPRVGSGYGTQAALPFLNSPITHSVAVDAAGNVFATNFVQGEVVKLPWTGIGYGAQTTVVSGLHLPEGVAVDADGNLYVADTGNNRVVKVPWTGTGYGTLSTLTSAVSGPTNLALDAAGNLYIADSGNNRIVKLPRTSGGYGPQIVYMSGLLAPTGVAVDASGNVYIADTYNSLVVKIGSADPPSMSFATATAAGSVDTTDGPLTVTVGNSGNQPLVFASSPVYPSAFPQNSAASGLCAAGTSLEPGDTCNVSANFRPAVSGANSGSVVLTTNHLNQSGATHSVPFAGTGTAPVLVTVTASVTAANKAYDGTTAATITGCTLTGVASGDTVTCSAGAASFASANAGNGITVTATGITLGGANASGYTLSSTTATTSANIVPSAQAALVVTGVPGEAKPYGATFTVASTGGSGTGAVTFTGTGACAASGTTITMTSGTGTCTVTATRAADSNYTSVTSAAYTVEAALATQAALTVTGAPAEKAYGATFTVGTTGGSSTGAVTFTATGACSASGATITMTASTGTCSVTATKAADTNYAAITSAAATVAATATAQATLLVTGVPAEKVYGTTFTVGSSGGSGGGAVTFTGTGACSASGTTITMTSGTGTCTITATKAADATYSSITSAPYSVTAALATQAALTVTGAPAEKANGATFTVGTSGGSSTGAVTFTATGACSVSGSTVTMTASTGTCSVTATKAGDTNYAAITSAAATVAATAAGGALKLVFTTAPPATATVGAAFTTVVQVQDGAGNLATSSTASITITSTAAGVTGTTTLVASGGIARFTNLVLNTAGTYTLTATASGITSATSTPIAIFTAATVSLAASPAPVTLGRQVTLTATVTPSAATGKVTFYGGAAVLGVSTIASGKAVLKTTLLAAGSHSLKARYGGDATRLAALSSAVALTATATAEPGFLPPASAPVGTAPQGAAMGDFNADGKADLAVANSGSNNVSVLLGTGAGTFQAAVNYAAGTAPAAVAVGDFNGDGKADLAVANTGSNNVSILLGTGTGTFQSAVNYAAGTAPVAISVSDFNGDGAADLVLAGPTGLSVLLGNGDGTFRSPATYATGAAASSVVAADFDGDGTPDLAAANAALNNIAVLLGTGDGTFQPAVTYTAGTNPQSLAVGDFNADGKLDLAVANASSDNVSVLLGTGTGAFQPAVNYTAGTAPQSVAVSDFNGDGKLDLAVTNNAGGKVSVLTGTGAGAFQAPVSYAAAAGAYALVAGEFNSDGMPDLAVTNNTAGSVSLLIGGALPPTVVSYNVIFGSKSFNLADSTRARLPWQITAIQVVFSRPITTGDASSLGGITATGLTGLGTNTLTWTSPALSQGSFTISLAGTGTHVLKDAFGIAIATTSRSFKLLWGDVNDDGSVTTADMVLVNAARSAAYSIYYDANGDGVVDLNDVNAVRARIGTSQP